MAEPLADPVDDAGNRYPHETVPIQVWVDVDKGIVDLVLYLNTIEGVRTHASCQGTIGEGGPNPYRAQVLVTWENAAILERLRNEFDVTIEGLQWGYVHPRQILAVADGKVNR